ncbi:tripartite tricarboxylate transporter substrate-binding protein [Acidovorax sp. LjRoot118]|uniref:Bug family tripartite tricarboxylate transporter substrate binding protein n=1 Tax=Acidovorax sp. LjRoot118 TaxID=3342256 RepID=UPI003ECCB47F
MKHRFRLLRTLALASLMGAALSAFGQADPRPAPASPDRYPTRPIRLFIGQAPGGAVDTIARLAAERLATRLGQPVVVDNRPGAGGMLAAEAIARAAPDGYSIGLLDVGPLAVNPVLQPKVSYDVTKDFRYIGTVAKIPLVMVAKPDLSSSRPADLVAHAKANPAKLTYGSAGVGSPPHLAFETFKARSGVFITHIPYRGGAPALADVVAGHVDLTFIDTNLASQYQKSGKVKAMAVAMLERSPLMPEVPTFNESGLKGFEFAPWVGVVGPAAMPAEAATRLAAALDTVVASPEFISRLQSLGFAPFANSPASFSALVRSELQSYRTLIKERGITLEN